MLFLAGIITSLLEETKRIGYITTIALGVMEGIFFLYKGSIYGQSEPVVYDEAMCTIENWKSAVSALTRTPVS